MGKEDDSQSLLETSLETMSMSTDASYISFFEAAEEGTVISDDACRPAYSYGAISSSTPATVEASAMAKERQQAEQQADDEMNNPWPATFQRSVRILSKPILDRELVAFASESMHIIPPTKLKKNTSLSDLNRGWRTPDPSPESRKVNRACELEEDDNEDGGIFQRMGIKRTLTSDWYDARKTELQRLEIFENLRRDEHRQWKKEKSNKQTKKIEEGDKKIYRDMVGEDMTTKATFGQCVFNVANTLMGMGILSLPFCLKKAGWLGGLLALLVFGTVTWWTSILIGRELNGDPRTRDLVFKNDKNDRTACDGRGAVGGVEVRLRRQLTSFPDIAREAFGQKSNIVLSSVLYFELFSALAVFFVSLGDHLHSLFPTVSATHHMMTASIVLIFPTVLCKTPRLLSYLSAVGTFTTVAVVLAVFVAAILEGDISAEMTRSENSQTTAATDEMQSFHSVFIPTGLPIGFGLVAYCFGGHAVVPTIYNSMAQPRDYERMIGCSYALVMSCCILVAVSGYYMFGSSVLDQITISLEKAPIDAGCATTILTWLMIVTSMSKFSLYLFPLALAVEEIIAPYVPTDQVMEISFMVIKFAFIASSLMVGICIPSFAFLCSLVGLICTIIVSVIFPAAAHLKLFSPHLKDWEKCVDWLLILGGLSVGVIGTFATVVS